MGSVSLYIPENQDAWRLEIDTGEDLSISADQFIAYVQPDGTVGQWDAIVDGDPVDGKIFYDFAPSQFLTKGDWSFQSKIEWVDTRVSYGKPRALWIDEELGTPSVEAERIVAYYEADA